MRTRSFRIATLVAGLTIVAGATAALRYRNSAADKPRVAAATTAAVQDKQVPVPTLSRFLETDGLEFERKIIRGAPFSATLIIETEQTLSDGSSKTQKSVSLIYRDAQGRTRRDRMPPDVSEAEIASKTPQLTTINDPVAGFSYLLEHRANTARRSIFSVQPEPDPNESRMIIKNSASAREGAGSSQMRPVPETSGPKQKLQSRGDAGVSDRKEESLGQREIEGITAEGTRTTMSIPAGTIGNDRPVETVVERWYSPDLKTVVLIERTDPRFGKSVFRLTSIKRADPAAALFIVPSELKIIPN